MVDDLSARVERVARRRIAQKQAEIQRSLNFAAEGNPLAAEKIPRGLSPA